MTEQLLSGAIAGLLGIFFKFIFDLGLKKLSISSDLKKNVQIFQGCIDEYNF